MFVLIEAQPKVEALQAGQSVMLKCLSDSGCFRSCIDQSIVQKLNIPVRSQPGHLILANKSRVPRVGTTIPLKVTLLFWGGDSANPRPQPMQIQYEFEILPAVERNGHKVIFGRDLMKIASKMLIQRGLEPELLFPFATGLSLSQLRENESFGDLTANALVSESENVKTFPSEFTVSSIELSETEAELIFDEAEELSPARMEYLTEENLEAEYSREREKILNHPDVLRELEINSQITDPINHPDSIVKLRLKAGIDPRKLNRQQYNVPHAKLAIINEKVSDWDSRSKIEIAPYLSDRFNINNALLCVPKKSGGEIIPNTGRVCMDPRPVNSGLDCDDQFEIPQIRRQLEKFAGAKIFGELDLEEAFLQFPVDEASRHLLCFTWNGSQYRFTCMPFGVKFMTSFCHRFVSTRVREAQLQFCDPFVDNLPFASSSWNEHREHLVALLRLCNRLNMKVKASSIKVGFSKMKCLGHVVSAEGVSMDPRKMETITQWPRPTTGAQMESFLGFAAFIRQHIRHYSDLSAPLVSVKNEKTIVWNDLLEESFNTLKKAIETAPILKFPDYSRLFNVATDASNLGCGGVLYQPNDGETDVSATNIVAICSKKWGSSQKRYSAYKKELFGLVYCLRKFHQYIWGRTDIVVYTDHKPLTYMFSQPELPVVLQQWMDLILDYSFTIHHRPGILNVVPDQLSRMFAANYDNKAWGVPSHIRFEGIPESINSSEIQVKTMTRSAFSKGEKSAVDSNADNLPDDNLLQLQVEMERLGKSVPEESKRDEFIQQEHLLGHFGRDAIFNKLYDDRNIWWPGMRQQIQKTISKCDACARFVVVKSGFKPAQFIAAPGPWHHVQFDCKVKLPNSPEGFTTLLVFIDVFSGFVLLFPVKTPSAECIAEKLLQVCTTFGFPAILQSDNGTEFNNKVVEAMSELMKLDRRFIAPYNPRCDGKVERAISVIMSVIKKLLQGADHLWPLFCPMAQLCVNNRISSVTQSTPFSLMFARENPVMGPWGDQAASESVTLDEWKSFQRQVNEAIYPSIFRRTIEVKKRMTSAVDKKRRIIRDDAFPVGSWVALKDPKREDKREPNYLIKFQVVRKDRNGNIVIREALSDGKIVQRKVTPDQLKSVEPDDESENKSYEVEKILKHRGSSRNYEYFVLWKGYPIEQATWQPASSFLDNEIIRDYWKSKSDSKSTKI